MYLGMKVAVLLVLLALSFGLLACGGGTMATSPNPGLYLTPSSETITVNTSTLTQNSVAVQASSNGSAVSLTTLTWTSRITSQTGTTNVTAACLNLGDNGYPICNPTCGYLTNTGGTAFTGILTASSPQGLMANLMVTCQYH
jgi:hypothetical protein